MTVINNWVYQIYDTGLTFQSRDSSAFQTNIIFERNLIEYCQFCIEAWVTGPYTNIHFRYNVLRMVGYQIGMRTYQESQTATGRDYRGGLSNPWSAALLNVSGFNKDYIIDFTVEKNIIDKSIGTMHQICQNSDEPIRYIDNMEFQQTKTDNRFAYYTNSTHPYPYLQLLHWTPEDIAIFERDMTVSGGKYITYKL